MSAHFVQQQICKSNEKILHIDESFFKIFVTKAARQSISRGGAFYLQPSDQDTRYFITIHKALSSFMQQNQVRTSEFISICHPHVSLTTPITQDIVSSEQEISILKAINNKIDNLIVNMPEMLTLQSIAILIYGKDGHFKIS